MGKPERIYEDRRVPVGYRHQCEGPGCGKTFTSKRRARFCSTPCRSAFFTDRNRRGREMIDERAAQTDTQA